MKGLWSQSEEYKATIMNNAPPELARFLNEGEITDGRISQALTIWQSYCEQARGGNVRAADYALLLTGAIQNYLGILGDQDRMRALFETTMDALPSPAHKQVIRCRLARAALKAGEVDAARAWLATCDPEPTDLEADSDYRFTSAFFATVDADYGKVLAALGPTSSSVPMSVAMSLIADVYRANAVEKGGDIAAATSLLVESIRARPDETAAVLGQIAEANAQFDLCPQSIPLATDALGAPREAAAPASEQRHGLFRHRG